MVDPLEEEGLGPRLQRLMRRTRPALTVEQVAEACNVSVQAVYKWFAEGKVARKHVAVLTSLLGVSSDELLFGKAPTAPAEAPPPEAEEFTFVPRVHGPMLSAGPGQYAWKQEVVDNSHAFRREWLKQKGLYKDQCRLITVKGDSMSPYLQDGDSVLVNMADRAIRSGEVYAIAVEEELRVKRLVKRSDGALEVRSDNPSPQYPTEVLEGRRIERLNVIGRVVWRGG
jgi:phage repressor protein C with HTH and peptisase S24 domain